MRNVIVGRAMCCVISIWELHYLLCVSFVKYHNVTKWMKYEIFTIFFVFPLSFVCTVVAPMWARNDNSSTELIGNRIDRETIGNVYCTVISFSWSLNRSNAPTQIQFDNNTILYQLFTLDFLSTNNTQAHRVQTQAVIVIISFCVRGRIIFIYWFEACVNIGDSTRKANR